MHGCKAVSTLHQPKNEILSFFKFLQKKVSRLGERNFLHLLNEERKLFSAKIWKWEIFIYGLICNSLVSGHLGTLLVKSGRVWGWFIPNTFQGLHFVFSGAFSWSIYIWVICAWNKFEEKRCVMTWNGLRGDDWNLENGKWAWPKYGLGLNWCSE